MQRRQFSQSLMAAGAGLLVSPPTFAATAQTATDVNVVHVGCSLDLTGPLCGSSRELKQGLDAGLAQANRHGVQGRTIKLTALDDGYNAQRSADNVRQLIADTRTVALVSCTGTANNQRILPLVQDAQIPYVAPHCGATSLRRAEYTSVFHVRASYADETQHLTRKLIAMGIHDLAVVYQGNAYGQEFLADYTEAAKSAGIKGAIKAFKIDAAGSDMGAVVAQTLASKPGAVLLGTAGNVTPMLIHTLEKASPSLPLATTSMAMGAGEQRKLGSDAAGLALSMVVPNTRRVDLAVVRDYQEAMRAIGVHEFSAHSLEGYVNARVLVEGLERTGKDLTRAKLRTALAGIRHHDLGGMAVDFGNGAPYLGSRLVALGILSTSGHVIE